MITPHTENQLRAMQASEATYQPSSQVAASLHRKTLIMLVGPVAIGKSFVIHQITAKNPEFKQVSVFTTRDARPDDDLALFRIYPHTDESLAKIFDSIKKRTLVQYTVHPTTHRVYGTEASDFRATYNILPTMSGAVEAQTHLPFEASRVICLAARPEVWQMWLNSRYPSASAERTKRINEAIISLEWSLARVQQSRVCWVENNIQTPEKTIEDIINIVKYNQPGDEMAREYATQMLELAKTKL